MASISSLFLFINSGQFFMRILLIEDDNLIGNGLQIGLTKLGFAVDWFTDGKTGMDALTAAPYDAVVLDLTLPKLDGLDVLQQWRAKHQDVPVLILTARDTLDERVKGLQSGADDYLCKPFALAEVAARLQALIRRRYGHHHSVIEHAGVKLDPNQRSVWLNNQEKLSSWDEEISSGALDVHIYNLRQKLGKQFIRTVHGVGYALGVTQ